jgi:GNAT superfamily N-acetyltransferase
VSDAPVSSTDASARLRPVDDVDAAGLTRLVGDAFAEHPGCVLDLDGLDADLLAPATAAARAGARWWVLDGPGPGLAATVGAGAPHGDTVELKRLYVAAAARGRGVGAELVRHVERHAAGLGLRSVQLWSDTRFTDAHRLYRRLGYTGTGRTRDLHDPSATTERHFLRPISPRGPEWQDVWDGPHGADRCSWTPLPDGTRLHGVTDDGLAYEVETDARLGVRRVEVRRPGRALHMTGDGLGRWWVDGDRREDLDGCRALDLPMTPAAHTLAVRAGIEGEVRVVSVRWPDLDVVADRHHLERLGPRRWVRRAGGSEHELVVDDDGLVVSYETWRRRA